MITGGGSDNILKSLAGMIGVDVPVSPSNVRPGLAAPPEVDLTQLAPGPVLGNIPKGDIIAFKNPHRISDDCYIFDSATPYWMSRLFVWTDRSNMEQTCFGLSIDCYLQTPGEREWWDLETMANLSIAFGDTFRELFQRTYYIDIESKADPAVWSIPEDDGEKHFADPEVLKPFVEDLRSGAVWDNIEKTLKCYDKKTLVALIQKESDMRLDGAKRLDMKHRLDLSSQKEAVYMRTI